MKQLQALLILTIFFCSAPVAENVKDERIRVFIEEPAEGESYSGILNLRGWAVAPDGLGVRPHDVYIDGVFRFTLPPGGKRSDVGSAYPDYPGSDMAGFSMAFNYKDLEPGSIRLRFAWDVKGLQRDSCHFSTERSLAHS